MRQLGDEAVLIDVDGPRAAVALARGLRAREVIPGADTVGLVGPYESLPVAPPPPARRRHLVPVALDGEDASHLGLAPSALRRLLEDCELTVAYLGFMPGFAYLEGLPEPLCSLARRPSPRPQVPAGSLAVAGGYAGIYPSASPGGWHLLGHTNLRLFDQDKPPHALFAPGDLVRFEVVASLGSPPVPPRRPLFGDALEVIDPGPLALLEDLGRTGAGALGVPRAGAFDSCWARTLNLAVGNSESAALIESAGPLRLAARRDLHVAVGGAELFVADSSRPAGIVASVGAGQEIALGPPVAGRSYLAVGGGIGGGESFNSRSADAVSGLAPGPLRAGDSLPLAGPPGRARLRFFLPPLIRPCRLRVLAGPDSGFADALAGCWRVSRLSDRTGLRLERDGPLPPGGTVASHAVVPGAIQLPPGGSPIVLGPDCGPVGGYPVVATVVSADLWKLAHLTPGDAVSFEAVSLQEAAAARQELAASIARAVQGWFPTAFA